MKRYLTAVILLWLTVSPAAYGRTFISVRSGNWHSPCTWSSLVTCASLPVQAGVTVPGPDDEVIISNKHQITTSANVTVGSVSIDNGTGGDKTMLTVAANTTFRVGGALRIDLHGELVIGGGALVYTQGDVCVKNSGNISVEGSGLNGRSTFIAMGCLTVGATTCVPGGSGSPSFVDPTHLDYCIACAANSGSRYEGTSGFCNRMLPVKLVSFQARYQPHPSPQVLLTWLVAQQENNAFFTLERSKDGLHFEPLNQVEGSGTSTASVQYTFLDTHPLPTQSYYRLSQTDRDGSTSTSKVISVFVPAADVRFVTLVPNPFDGQVLTCYYAYSETIELQVTDAYGVALPQHAYCWQATTDRATLTFRPALPKGMFLVKLRMDKELTTRKLIVQ